MKLPVVITDVTQEPLSIAELKEHVQYNGNESKVTEELVRMGRTARQLIESYTERALAVKTIDVEFETEFDYNDGYLTFPVAPVNSITSFVSLDQTGSTTSLTSGSDYYLIGQDRKQVYLPSILNYSDSDYNAIIGWRARVNVGYSYGSMPEVYKECMLKLVWEWYNNRMNYVPQLNSEVMTILTTQGDKGWL